MLDLLRRMCPFPPGSEGFFHALSSDPDNSSCWLAYADWLDEYSSGGAIAGAIGRALVPR